MREWVRPEAADERLCNRVERHTGLERPRMTLASPMLTVSDFLACVRWLQWSPCQSYLWLADVQRAYERWMPVWPKPHRYEARKVMFRLRFMAGDYAQARRLISRKFAVCCDTVGESIEQFAARSRGADRKARNFDAALSFHWSCAQALPETLRRIREPQAAATRRIVSEMEWLYFHHQLCALIKLLEASGSNEVSPVQRLLEGVTEFAEK